LGFGTKILKEPKMPDLNVNDFKTEIRFKSRTFSFYLELKPDWRNAGLIKGVDLNSTSP
jgi:hypothetical protein